MNQDRDQYGQGAAYFYKINKNLLVQKRIELDAKKNEMTDQSNNPNWECYGKYFNSRHL